MTENAKKEFDGELRGIPPSRLFNEKEKDPLASFFLVLAVIFNDIKGLLLFQEMLVDRYRKPEPWEKSVHAGEFWGLHMQLTRLLVGTLHEILKFLEEHKKEISSPEFRAILVKINNKKVENAWNDIVSAALDASVMDSEFTKNLNYIRNNVSFHYNQGGKELRRAFLNVFLKRPKSVSNDHAYYTIGEDESGTRFFYADAATEEYLRMMSSRKDVYDSMSGYSPELIALIQKTNFVISRILKTYLKNLPKSNSEIAESLRAVDCTYKAL